MRLPGQIPRHRHAETGGNRCRGMRRSEAVVFAFRAFGEAREAATLAKGPDLVPPGGEDLVRIGLMANIPDQPVARRVEEIMERDGQLDDAEPCPKMPPSH